MFTPHALGPGLDAAAATADAVPCTRTDCPPSSCPISTVELLPLPSLEQFCDKDAARFASGMVLHCNEHDRMSHAQGQTEAAAELFRRAAAGAGDMLVLLKQEPGSLQSPLHPAELHVDALLGHAQMLAATQRCGIAVAKGGSVRLTPIIMVRCQLPQSSTLLLTSSWTMAFHTRGARSILSRSRWHEERRFRCVLAAPGLSFDSIACEPVLHVLLYAAVVAVLLHMTCSLFITAQQDLAVQIRGGREAARGGAAGGGGHQRRRPPARRAGAADAGRGLRPHPPHQLRGGPVQVRRRDFHRHADSRHDSRPR